MDYRTEVFTQKFTSALPYFKQDSIQGIVSIKYRDACPNSSEYMRFINDYIKGELHLDAKELDGKFQGKAWLVSDSYQNKVILVEHETGLEILYIAGSIASLVALVPMINAGWKYFKDRHSYHSFHPDEKHIEIRKFDSENIIVEQHIQNIEAYILNANAQENCNTKTRLENLEKEIVRLKKKVYAQNKIPRTSKKRKKSKR